MACGDAYARIWLVTDDGDTPEDLSTTEGGAFVSREAAEWIAVARRVQEEVRRRWGRVQRSAAAQPLIPRDLPARVEAWGAEVDGLPSPWLSLFEIEARNRALGLARKGCCLAEEIDGVISKAELPAVKDMGGHAPPSPTTGGIAGALGGGLKSAALLAAGAGVVYLLARGERDV